MDPLIRPIEDDVELAIQAMESRVPDLDARREGTLVNGVAGVATLLRRDAMRFALREVAKTFVATAQGEDLDRLALDHFGLVRHPATAAVGTVQVYRSAGDGVSVPEGARLLDESGAVYTVMATTGIVGTTGALPVQAAGTGAETNRRPEERFTATGSNWPAGAAGWLMTNLGEIAGGNAGESDEAFRDRIGAWWRSLRRGTVEAVRYAALSVPEVRRATVNETRIRPQRGGYVDLYVSDSQDAYSQEMGRLVRKAVDLDGRAAGVVLNVIGAVVVSVPITLRIRQRAGASGAAIERAVAAVLEHVNGLAIGASLRRSRVAAAALSADSSLTDVEVVVPSVDQVARAQDVIRCSRSEVTLA